ncbi:MAG: YggS family pyridoxal phosphate-dependent enzyme [Thermonemataceae bacterium]|nr:YggS family pyridoxal phosphate-dependent enzyme [Thermonemataceae bacterium]
MFLYPIYQNIKESIAPTLLVAVSKTKPMSDIQEAYEKGCKDFGENKVQELVEKHEALAKDIRWHLIGHLQRNKVKYIAPFIHLIHSVDSLKLLEEIDKQAQKNKRIIDCLLQIYIAQEETKFGLSMEEAQNLLEDTALAKMQHIRIVGMMGMASLTANKEQIHKEFAGLRKFFELCRGKYQSQNIMLQELSMGMSSDYEIAIQEGSSIVRIGSALFGSRI